MKSIKQFTSRMLAVMLAGTLAVGSVSVSAFGAEDAGSTVAAAEEFSLEEATEEGVVEPSSAETVDEEVMTESSSAEVVDEEGVSESPDAAFADTSEIAAEEAAVTTYTVTLDANGGYFANEWDDILNETLEKTEILNKIIPVGGIVSTVPVYEQEGTTATFLGWSLERDGEILPQEQEGYVPGDNCVLYAVWQVEEIQEENRETDEQELDQVEDDSENISDEEYEDIVTTDGEDDVTLDQEQTAPDNGNQVNQSVDIIEEEKEESLKTDAALSVVESGTCGDNLTWTLDGEGTLTISGTGEMYDYSLAPWKKTSAASKRIKNIIIGNGVTRIGKDAFSFCQSVETVHLPAGLKSIGKSAFEMCTVSRIVIPMSCNDIENNAFFRSFLETIVFMPGLNNINSYSFCACSKLKELIIPDSVKTIGGFAFGAMYMGGEIYSSLNKVWFMGSAPEIHEDSFWGNTITAYYLMGDDSWDDVVKEQYSGKIKWECDEDLDGIPDLWERFGADINGDLIIDLDFPRMGAKVGIPDVFVEIDWMKGYRPKPEALKMVYEKYKEHGIQLHIDAGSDSTDYVTGKQWLDMSGGGSVAYSDVFYTYNWADFIKDNFKNDRYTTFHHCLFLNKWDDGSGNYLNVTGVTHDLAKQVMLVADIDGFTSEKTINQAGTFMHELGHSLGLNHTNIAKDDPNQVDELRMNDLPNHLSVMNYSFQFGLVGVDDINYSEYVLPALDERNLSEKVGIDPEGITTGSGIGTEWFYKENSKLRQENIAKKSINYNNNYFTKEEGLQIDLNGDGDFTILPASVNEWEILDYYSGQIGKGVSINEASNNLSDDINLPVTVNEPSIEMKVDPIYIGEAGIIDTGSCGTNVTWKLYDDGKLVISGNGNINNYQANGSSASPWKSYSEMITSIVFEEGVTGIGDNAFNGQYYNYSKLESIVFGSSIQTIGNRSFYYAISSHEIKTISLNEGLESIGDEAFMYCRWLKRIYLPRSLKECGMHVLGQVETLEKEDGIWARYTGYSSGTQVYVYVDSFGMQLAQNENYEYEYYDIDIEDCEVTSISNKTYTGKSLTQSPTVSFEGLILRPGEDYTITYSNNTNAGTATITITGKGNYTGTKTATFKINKANQPITIKSTATSIAVGKTATVSTTGNKGKVTYKSSNTAIATVNASTGVVTGKKAGTVTITASAAATANYNAASKTVKITVTANKSLKKPGNCHFAKWNNSRYTSCRISWNKVDGAEGYETLLSWTNGSNASRTIVKSNVLYRDCTVHPQHVSQMMVRAFYTAGGKRVFGPWSNVEYITPSPTRLTTKNASSGTNLKMNISWNIIYGCNGYNVFLATNPNGTWYWNQSTSTKADATSAMITKYRGSSLKKNTRYYVRIVTRRQRNGVFCTVPMPASNTYIGSFIIK